TAACGAMRSERLPGIAVAVLCASASLAFAQAPFPSKPLRLVVPFPAGGPVDLSARTLAPKLSAALAQTVLVDNRAGAATIIGTDLVAKSPPDGYTWVPPTHGSAVN